VEANKHAGVGGMTTPTESQGPYDSDDFIDACYEQNSWDAAKVANAKFEQYYQERLKRELDAAPMVRKTWKESLWTELEISDRMTTHTARLMAIEEIK
jgi:hypothetical protein